VESSLFKLVPSLSFACDSMRVAILPFACDSMGDPTGRSLNARLFGGDFGLSRAAGARRGTKQYFIGEFDMKLIFRPLDQ